jgi:hypothetical protein
VKPVKGEAYFLSNPSELPDPTRREWLAEVGARVLLLVTLRSDEVRFRGDASSLCGRKLLSPLFLARRGTAHRRVVEPRTALVKGRAAALSLQAVWQLASWISPSAWSPAFNQQRARCTVDALMAPCFQKRTLLPRA